METRPRRASLAHMLITMASAGLLVSASAGADDRISTRTPIKHIVVIFQENVSYDHYFGTYPYAKPNNNGSRFFGKPRDDTPRSNTLLTAGLLTNNPNGVNPFRIDRSVPVTCDQDHDYGDEQFAFHGGLMDRFVTHSCNDANLGPNSTLGYYDGNTVTALWNYAQHYAMSDNSFGTSFGPSTPGMLNLVAGTTYMGTITNGLVGSGDIANGATSGSVIGDPDPAGDVCSNPEHPQIIMSGENIGDRLNAAGITWGHLWEASTTARWLITMYPASVPMPTTFRIMRLADRSLGTRRKVAGVLRAFPVLKTDQANHQYDLSRFFIALANRNLPAVSFLKARAFQDGHAGYSDPLDEQAFIVGVVNGIMRSPQWHETAIVIAYDDSDGWYDHVMGPIVFQSNTSDDQLFAAGSCGQPKENDPAGGRQNGRCGYGPRLPLLVISPWAKKNYINHEVTDQSSIIRFVEDNWGVPRIGNGSADAVAGSLNSFFDFHMRPRTGRLILDERSGTIVLVDP